MSELRPNKTPRRVRAAVVLTTLVLSAACSFSGGTMSSGSVPSKTISRATAVKADTASGPISHVVVIIQENRSFENFFAGYPGANAPLFGCGKMLPRERVRAQPETGSGCPVGDNEIPLHQVTFEQEPNLSHLIAAAFTDWDGGRMDGFTQYGQKSHVAAYAYVDRAQLAPYWTMAQQYVLADAMYPTEFGPSWTAHLTLVAGTDNLNKGLALADFSDGPSSSCSAPYGSKTTTMDLHRVVRRAAGPFPCLKQFRTMATTLDLAGVSWKYYVGRKLKSFIWSPFSAISYVYHGPDWDNNIILPQTQVLRDIAAGKLASVSWVTPSKEDSDHPGSRSDTGPSWVTSIVNAIGESPYWTSTAIVILWDDWGGFYDNAAPPQLDFRGLGIRVPCLIVSAYAKQNYVSHTQYEYGSILKFIEEVFPNVGRLGAPGRGYTDQRAASISDSFNLLQTPRPFVPIQSKYGAAHFLREPASTEPVDSE